MIHVAFGFSDVKGTYSKCVATTMVSVLDHTTEKITFHILHDDTLSETNRILLKQTAERFGGMTVFYKVQFDQDMVSLDSVKNITIGTLFRLMIPNTCCELCKIIYLDGDVLVQLDLNELWKIDLTNNCLGAVPDVEITKKNYIDNRLYKHLGVAANCYFNSGILVLNLEEIRKQMDLGKEGIRILKNHPHLPFADQDVLNIIFQRQMIELPTNYNFQVDLLDDTQDYSFLEQSKIFHFSGTVKPWFAPQPFVQKLYYSYMAQTAYVQSVEDLIDIMSSSVNLYKEKIDLQKVLRYYPGTGKKISALLGMRFIFPEKLYWKILPIVSRWEKKWRFR